MRPIDRPNNLDSVRLIAAIMVLLAHSCVPFEEWRQAYVAGWGRIAVMTFFVLSGYLITASWQANPRLLDYTMNRLLRLLPALAVVVVLAAVVLGPVMTTWPLKDYFTSNMFAIYFKNLLIYPMSDRLPGVFDTEHMLSRAAVNGSLWTLRIEFTMYIMVAALGVLRLLRPWVMALVLCAFWLLYLKYWDKPLTLETLFWYMEIKEIARFGVSFAIGSLIRLADAKWCYSTKTAVLVLAAMFISYHFSWHFESFLFAGLPMIVLWLSFCPWLRLPNFAKYGDFSYGVYIYGFPIQQTYLSIFGVQGSMIVFFITSTALAILCGAFSWHLIEKQALKLKRKTVRNQVIAKDKPQKGSVMAHMLHKFAARKSIT